MPPDLLSHHYLSYCDRDSHIEGSHIPFPHYPPPDIISNQNERRRHFHNFVCDRAQEEKLFHELNEENIHLEYLDRVDRLRRERERLNRKEIKVQSAYFSLQQKLNYESDRIINTKFVRPMPSSKFEVKDNNSEILRKNIDDMQDTKIENERSFSPVYKVRLPVASKAHGKGMNAVQFAIDEKDKVENEKWFSEVESKMMEVRNKIIDKKGRQRVEEEEVRNIEQNIRRRKELEERKREYEKKGEELEEWKREHEKKKKGEELEKIEKYTREKQKQNQKEKEMKVRQQNDIQAQKTRINKVPDQSQAQQKTSNGRLSKLENAERGQKVGERREAGKLKNRNRKKGGYCHLNNSVDSHPRFSSLAKMRNRLQLSIVVYEDAEHRTLNHEKNHLERKYDNECKIRKDIISKICATKSVNQKYNIILI